MLQVIQSFQLYPTSSNISVDLREVFQFMKDILMCEIDNERPERLKQRE